MEYEWIKPAREMNFATLRARDTQVSTFVAKVYRLIEATANEGRTNNCFCFYQSEYENLEELLTEVVKIFTSKGYRATKRMCEVGKYTDYYGEICIDWGLDE